MASAQQVEPPGIQRIGAPLQGAVRTRVGAHAQVGGWAGGGGAAQLLQVSWDRSCDGSLRRVDPGAGATFALVSSDEQVPPNAYRPPGHDPARPGGLLRA